MPYGILTQGLEYAMFNYYKKVWNKKETMEYLKLLDVGTCTSTYAINYENSEKTEYNNTILADFNQLKVGYCCTKPFTIRKDFKTSGWIAETYLGYS